MSDEPICPNCHSRWTSERGPVQRNIDGVDLGVSPCRDRWHLEPYIENLAKQLDAEQASLTELRNASQPNYDKLALNDWDIRFLRDMQIEVPNAN